MRSFLPLTVFVLTSSQILSASVVCAEAHRTLVPDRSVFQAENKGRQGALKTAMEYYRTVEFGVPTNPQYSFSNPIQIVVLKGSELFFGTRQERADLRLSQESFSSQPNMNLATQKMGGFLDMLWRIKYTPETVTALNAQGGKITYQAVEPYIIGPSAHSPRDSQPPMPRTYPKPPSNRYEPSTWPPGNDANSIRIRAMQDLIRAQTGAAATQLARLFDPQEWARDGGFRYTENGQTYEWNPFAWMSVLPSPNSRRSDLVIPEPHYNEPPAFTSSELKQIFSETTQQWFQLADKFPVAKVLKQMKIPVEKEINGPIKDQDRLLAFLQHLTGDFGQEVPKMALVEMRSSLQKVPGAKGNSKFDFVYLPDARSEHKTVVLVMGITAPAKGGQAKLQVIGVSPHQFTHGDDYSIKAGPEFFESVQSIQLLDVDQKMLTPVEEYR